MIKKNPLFLAIFIFIINTLNFYPLFGQTPQYENKVIEKIEVIINAPSGCAFDIKTVLSRIKTKEGDLFSQNEFDNDLKILAQEFDKVEPGFTVIDNRMIITLKIWPKPTIRTISWIGNDKITPKRLQKELSISTCSVFDRQAFNKAFHKLKAYYVKKGFFEAELQYEVKLDTLTNEVDIDINICEGRAGRIKDIVFVNFTKNEKEDILEMLVTKKYNLFTSWMTNEGTYNEEAVQHDQFTILNYLQNEGYADASVDINICEAEQDNRIIIYITATKGTVYYVGNLSFEGNSLFCDEDIWKQFTVCEGGIYSPDKIRDTVQNITNFYGKRGYIDAYVNYEPSLAGDECKYNIHFTIEEGEQFRVGLIKVFGNCSTQTKVILHESLLIPGEIFNIEKLQKTEERLDNIGFFKHVNVYAVKSDGPCGLGDNYRDVHIEVEETSTGQFGAFFGYSTAESIFGGLNLTERNFNCEGLGCFWKEGYRALRGGGEYAHITATVGAKSRSYVLSWTKPFFMDTKWTVGFDLETSSNRYIAKDYDIESKAYNVHAIYEINQFVKTGWHYRIKNTHIDLSGNIAAKEAYERAHGDHGPSLLKESRHDGIISATGISFIYDSTDHPQRPSKGFKSKLETEIAGIGGDFRFFSLAYLNNYYYKTDRKGVLKFRGDWRFIFTFGGTHANQIPLDERLFLGGDNMIRGYRPYKLGPRFIEGDPRGGYSMQIYSAEYIRRVMKRLDAFVFIDAGHLSFKQGNFGRISISAGYGVKFKIFENAPPLTLGMGYPLNPRSRGEVKKFFFNIGGRF